MEDARATLANEMAQSFTRTVRPASDYDPATSVVVNVDGTAQWIKDAIQEAHEGALPDDWTYEQCYYVAQALVDYDPDTWEDSLHEIVDSLVDFATNKLTAWLHSHPSRVALVDEAAEEFGEAEDTFKALQQGQFLETSRIAHALVAAINARAELIEWRKERS